MGGIPTERLVVDLELLPREEFELVIAINGYVEKCQTHMVTKQLASQMSFHKRLHPLGPAKTCRTAKKEHARAPRCECFRIIFPSATGAVTNRQASAIRWLHTYANATERSRAASIKGRSPTASVKPLLRTRQAAKRSETADNVKTTHGSGHKPL